MYPIEKYRFFQNGNKVIAVSTYAGKTVRGVAICHENDKFDLEKGKEIAATRCAIRIADKRLANAERRIDEAYDSIDRAEHEKRKAIEFYEDARDAAYEAMNHLEDLLKNL